MSPVVVMLLISTWMGDLWGTAGAIGVHGGRCSGGLWAVRSSFDGVHSTLPLKLRSCMHHIAS